MTSGGSLLRPAPRTRIRRAEATGGEKCVPSIGQRAYHRGGRRKCQSGHSGSLRLPGRSNTAKFVELQHNLGNGKEVMVAPQDMHWMPTWSFRRRVRQGQREDRRPALLKTLKENTEAANTDVSVAAGHRYTWSTG